MSPQPQDDIRREAGRAVPHREGDGEARRPRRPEDNAAGPRVGKRLRLAQRGDGDDGLHHPQQTI